METYNTNRGLPSAFPGDTQQSGRWWRPWIGSKHTTGANRGHSDDGDLSAAQQHKTPQVVHPVKLFWPKSRCFDYLYQDAVMLLHNYPVQATISLYEDSSSDEDSDDEEEEMEKELN
ncbi:Protein ripply2 [Liparis tanakae]|uniref:Protein ripply2 n=1 Tax=Liparis tanakae TaxID=230148 RepID=A0A4Z2G832_9TELE|nr:Protein ripply2 [Liparis tanakae]